MNSTEKIRIVEFADFAILAPRTVLITYVLADMNYQELLWQVRHNVNKFLNNGKKTIMQKATLLSWKLFI
jgi:hypothetical protein